MKNKNTELKLYHTVRGKLWNLCCSSVVLSLHVIFIDILNASAALHVRFNFSSFSCKYHQFMLKHESVLCRRRARSSQTTRGQHQL